MSAKRAKMIGVAAVGTPAVAGAVSDAAWLADGEPGPGLADRRGHQIRRGLTYIQGRYGSPGGAWSHEEADCWY